MWHQPKTGSCGLYTVLDTWKTWIWSGEKPSRTAWGSASVRARGLCGLSQCYLKRREKAESREIKTINIASKYFILFAEKNFFKFIISQSKSFAYCYNVATIFLKWIKFISNNLFDIIHARFFCFFIDVLCIFAN